MPLPAIRASAGSCRECDNDYTCGSRASDLSCLVGECRVLLRQNDTALLSFTATRLPSSCRAIKAEKYLSLMETGEEQKDALKGMD